MMKNLKWTLYRLNWEIIYEETKNEFIKESEWKELWRTRRNLWRELEGTAGKKFLN